MARGSTYSQGTANEQPITDFAPDLDPTTPGIVLDMEGADPSFAGYSAADTPLQFGTALPEAGAFPLGARGATFAFSLNTGNPSSPGNGTLIAGTFDHLYRYGGVSPLTPTLCDGGQTLPIDLAARWRFFQFGNHLIALSESTAPQLLTNITGGQFAPIPATNNFPPDGASIGCTAGGTAFLFLGDTWYASAPGSDIDWVPDVQTLAATGVLYDLPGPIVAAAPYYRSVIVWKQQAMWIGTFVGPPLSWSFQLLSNLTGTYSQECVVVLPEAIAFLGTDDFYITTGSTPQRIPNNLKEWFFDTVSRDNIHKTQGWYHSDAAIIYWHFVSSNSPSTNLCDMFVSYNVRSRRWGKGSRLVQCVPGPASQPVTPHVHGLYFDENSVPQSLNGPPGAMHLLTGWQGDPGRLTQFMRVRPKFNIYPDSQTLMAWHVNILSQLPVLPPLTIPAMGADDWFNLRQYDRYHQVGLSTVGPAEVVAFAYEGRQGGIR